MITNLNWSCRHVARVAIAAFLVHSLLAVGQEQKAVEKSLRSAIKGKVLILKTPVSGKSITFGQGKPKRGPLQEECPLPLCGLIRIEKVKVSPSRIELTGHRVALVIAPGTADLQPFDTAEQVQIELQSGQVLTADAQAEELILSAFGSGDSYQKTLRSYWKPLVSDKAQVEEAKNSGRPVGTLEGIRPVYLVKPGIINPPKPTYTPDPEYSEEARHKKISGTSVWTIVLNERGFPEILELSKPAGSGLDAAAANALLHWRFQPATKDGTAVTVKFNVEVTFHLGS